MTGPFRAQCQTTTGRAGLFILDQVIEDCVSEQEEVPFCEPVIAAVIVVEHGGDLKELVTKR